MLYLAAVLASAAEYGRTAESMTRSAEGMRISKLKAGGQLCGRGLLLLGTLIMQAGDRTAL